MIDDGLHEKLNSIEQQYMRLEDMMGAPETATEPKRLMELGRERADLSPLVEAYRRYKDLERQIRDTEELRASSDPEMAELARQGKIELRLHYGATGRPEHRYRIAPVTS